MACQLFLSHVKIYIYITFVLNEVWTSSVTLAYDLIIFIILHRDAFSNFQLGFLQYIFLFLKSGQSLEDTVRASPQLTYLLFSQVKSSWPVSEHIKHTKLSLRWPFPCPNFWHLKQLPRFLGTYIPSLTLQGLMWIEVGRVGVFKS